MKILAVDPGGKRTGLAISDPEERMALALPALEMKGNGSDADRVAAAARDRGAELIVIGLPLNMNGTEGPRARAARTFAEEVRVASGLPVETWDERLSTAEADDRLRAAGLNRRERARRSDSAAAIVILESFLARRRRGAP